jgi:hypothetical protein
MWIATTPAACPSSYQEINDLVFVVERHIVLDTLLVNGLQDHVTGAVGRMTGPAHRLLGRVIRMPAKRALSNFAVRRPIERQSHVFQIVDHADGFAA